MQKGKHYAIKVYDDLNRTMSEAEQEHWVFANHAIHPNMPNFFGMYKVKGTCAALSNIIEHIDEVPNIFCFQARLLTRTSCTS